MRRGRVKRYRCWVHQTVSVDFFFFEIRYCLIGGCIFCCHEPVQSRSSRVDLLFVSVSWRKRRRSWNLPKSTVEHGACWKPRHDTCMLLESCNRQGVLVKALGALASRVTGTFSRINMFSYPVSVLYWAEWWWVWGLSLEHWAQGGKCCLDRPRNRNKLLERIGMNFSSSQ